MRVSNFSSVVSSQSAKKYKAIAIHGQYESRLFSNSALSSSGVIHFISEISSNTKDDSSKLSTNKQDPLNKEPKLGGGRRPPPPSGVSA